LADTAIKTASSGYLTRKLVDIAQDVIVLEEDCGTLNGITKTSLGMEDEPGALADKIAGRTSAEDILDRSTGEFIVRTNEDITKSIAKKIEDTGISRIRVRSALTCESERGVCQKCYGADLSTWKRVNIGEAVGIIAAQSIGEPGTQLTMRTFHTGGAVSGVGEQSHVEAKSTGTVKYHNVSTVSSQDGILVVTNRNGEISVIDESGLERERHAAIYGATLTVADGGTTEKGNMLMEWDPHNVPILTEVGGRAKFEDIIEGVTMREEIDESTSLAARVIIEHREESLHARIAILNDNDEVLTRYDMSTGAHITIHDNDAVSPGDVLAKIPREISKAKDIVLGLPRVTELFEARKPKECATITEIDGKVEFAGISRGMRVLKVINPNGTESEYRIPRGKHLIVREGDEVFAGDRLTDGPVNPHDILSVLGENEVQGYLVDEVQEVYRTAGEHINDKHVEVIVGQMLRKVKVVESGGTDFLVGDEVPRVEFRKENQRVSSSGGDPATGEPILQGITKAALSTESFISAASFQQTTNVLTTAAISGKRDSLKGLKENVIMGHLIPAGSGVPQYRQLGAYADAEQPALPSSEEEEATAIEMAE
jgi:DNA-directed RNA polymerase subunit beta'